MVEKDALTNVAHTQKRPEALKIKVLCSHKLELRERNLRPREIDCSDRACTGNGQSKAVVPGSTDAEHIIVSAHA
jgi:hypothetical protein